MANRPIVTDPIAEGILENGARVLLPGKSPRYMAAMLDKTFDPAAVEARQYRNWEQGGAFEADPKNDAAPGFCIMMPPPNVTGSLHMGHALNHTLQDILTRFQRMRGKNVLWQPGTDHAGIATQMVVERQLAEEGSPNRQALGREAFLKRVWQWKAASGDRITTQLRRLGTTPDWSRERFTLDDGLSRAVTKVFVRLYEQGLLYRDKRLVNWDPHFQTAISDLEVEQRETESKLWHFRYPLADDPDTHIVVATTRPETMLGDVAIVVHPEDARYTHLVGKEALLPLVGRRLPIIADDFADPETGSGAVKITPAHDFGDFEVGRRHNLSMINILDAAARINENAPEAYRGLDRFAARACVVEDMDAQGLLATVEERPNTVPYGDRSGAVIEPWLTEQWFVDAETLAQPALSAVREGHTRFVPENWQNTYFDWLENIQPWCVSRQLWWGHRVPAWYGPDDKVFVAEDEAGAREAALAHYGRDVALRRDEDVLDTWFSSALWPFSTLGWPEQTPELGRFYPTDVLVTAFDIIFFWVARMMMMGLHFTGEVPFRTVYIHALVRDAKGQKMSKSKGNVLDPLDLIDKYGADALRLTLAALAAQGRDIKLSEDRVAGYRNFATKLWNAARYTQMNACRPDPDFDPAAVRQTLNRWIIGELADAAEKCTAGIEGFRFNDAAAALYHFTWHTFCDWYLEFSKPVLQGEDEAAKAEVRATTAWVLDRLLHLLNPVIPFVTEELYEQLAFEPGKRLITADWPRFDPSWREEAAAQEINWVVRLITEIRSLRADMNVPAAAHIPLQLLDASEQTAATLERYRALIIRLARLERAEVANGGAPEGSVQAVLGEARIVLPLADIIDVDKERARLRRQIEKLDQDIGKIDNKLANENFIAKAPAEVVHEQKERREEALAARAKLAGALSAIGAAA